MKLFRGQSINQIGFCKCKNHEEGITAETEEFGYWDVCCKCDKPLEDGFHYYNHYDGSDHDDCDI